MAKITELRDRDSGEVFYPMTAAEAVFFSPGKALPKEMDCAKVQLFIDMWNEAAGTYGHAGFDENGEFNASLNGITDIKLKEAMRIYSTFAGFGCIENTSISRLRASKCRTFFPRFFDNKVNMSEAYRDCTSLVVAPLMLESVHYTGWTGMQSLNFSNCINLTKVVGIIDVTSATFDRTFNGCNLLTTIYLKGLKANISFPHSPLSLTSLQYMVENAANTTAITITVRGDVFYKLTGDTSKSVVAALTEEELEQWQALVTEALNKNITFATI